MGQGAAQAQEEVRAHGELRAQGETGAQRLQAGGALGKGGPGSEREAEHQVKVVLTTEGEVPPLGHLQGKPAVRLSGARARQELGKGRVGAEGEVLPVGYLQGKPVVCLSAIGAPQGFEATAQRKVGRQGKKKAGALWGDRWKGL